MLMLLLDYKPTIVTLDLPKNHQKSRAEISLNPARFVETLAVNQRHCPTTMTATARPITGLVGTNLWRCLRSGGWVGISCGWYINPVNPVGNMNKTPYVCEV